MLYIIIEITYYFVYLQIINDLFFNLELVPFVIFVVKQLGKKA